MPVKLERAIAVAAIVVFAAVLAAVLTGCGGSKASSSSGSNETDRGFVDDMTPHHRSAIRMATIAIQRAQHREIRVLARNIITAQQREISALTGLKGKFAKQGADGHSTLPLDQSAMGMDMSHGDLQTASPFDRGFIDMMVRHHQGAIIMAQLELAKGTNATTKRLARSIIGAQQREIREMNAWRTKWYGAPVASDGGSMSMGG